MLRNYQVDFLFYLFLSTGEDQFRFADNLLVITDLFFFQQQSNQKGLKTPHPPTQNRSFCSRFRKRRLYINVIYSIYIMEYVIPLVCLPMMNIVGNCIWMAAYDNRL